MSKRLLALFLCMTLVLVAFAGCSNEDAEGEVNDYPTSSIKMIIPYSAGGGTDTLARAVGSYIDLDGQNFVPTNIEGANGLVASMELYNSPNDGYTVMCGIPETWVAQYMTESTDVELYNEMTPLASFIYDTNVISVKADSPFETFDDLVAYANENPDFTIASTGSGGSNEMTAYAIADAAGYDFTYVPFDGASKARVAMLGGHNDAWLAQASEVKALYDAGEIRALCVASEERVSFMPDVPTLQELNYDVVSGLHRSFWAPPGASEEAVVYLEAKLKEVFDNEEFKSLLKDDLGFDPLWVGSEDLGEISKQLAPKLSKWVDLIK